MANKQIDKIFNRTIIILVLLAIALSIKVYGSTRCRNYIQQEKLAHYEVFGIDYPYWFGVGQIQQESGCRNILSRDGIGSEGLPQITLRVWKKYLAKYAIYSIGSVRNQIKAQALIMRDCSYQNPFHTLWQNYSIYNGGRLVIIELEKAHSSKWKDGRKECKRKNIYFNNGQTINACSINYNYPRKVYKYGKQYRIFQSKYKYKFW